MFLFLGFGLDNLDLNEDQSQPSATRCLWWWMLCFSISLGEKQHFSVHSTKFNKLWIQLISPKIKSFIFKLIYFKSIPSFSKHHCTFKTQQGVQLNEEKKKNQTVLFNEFSYCSSEKWPLLDTLRSADVICSSFSKIETNEQLFRSVLWCLQGCG